MSQTKTALQTAVTQILTLRPVDGAPQSRRERALFDRAFSDLLKLIAPRTRHFIRQYGLLQHVEDAQQCCAIALHRALADYDPEKSQFTTFINWQIRGELQSLRFRLMSDRRPSARKTGARIISLHSSARSDDGEIYSLETMLEDQDALERTQAGASDYLAKAAANSLIDRYVAKQREAAVAAARHRSTPKRQLAAMPAAERRDMQERYASTNGLNPDDYTEIERKLTLEREVLARRVFGLNEVPDEEFDGWLTKDRLRQVTRRSARILQSLTETEEQFRLMACYRDTRYLAEAA